MKKINTRRLYYHLKHRYLTLNNVILAVALIIGAGWAWGSIGAMQRNYSLQQEVDSKIRQEKLVSLEVQNAQFERRYHQSDEYKELAVRERLGLANPGEKMLILPPNSQQAKAADGVVMASPAVTARAESDFQQWMNFLFGGNHRRLQD